jgi:hypothetical protein
MAVVILGIKVSEIKLLRKRLVFLRIKFTAYVDTIENTRIRGV